MNVFLSPNFKLVEFTRSYQAKRLGINNMPHTFDVAANLLALTQRVMEPIRSIWGLPVRITSGFRCPTLNAKIGGAYWSQHMAGEAADFKVRGIEAYEVAKAITEREIPFDQLICEARFKDGKKTSEWNHISHKLEGRQRAQVLTIIFVDGKRISMNGLHRPEDLLEKYQNDQIAPLTSAGSSGS